MPDSSKFLLDENMPKLVKKFLESKGFSAEYSPKSVANSEVALLAQSKRYVLLSRDRHFLNTDLFPPKKFSGIAVFVMHPPKAERLIKSLSLLLAETDEFEGKLFTIGEEGFEISED